MGTSSAILFATLYFALHEHLSILPTFKKSLIYYKRYIDDIFGIWTGPTTSWPDFCKTLDNFGNLRWKASKLSTSATFLDLQIKINPSTRRIETASYFKPMSLHLYIPPKSAHPPGCLRGMIHGQLRRFWLQNSNQTDYIRAVHHFFHKLISRGHDHSFLTGLFLESARKLEKVKKL